MKRATECECIGLRDCFYVICRKDKKKQQYHGILDGDSTLERENNGDC